MRVVSPVFVKSISSSPHFAEKRLNKLFIFIIFDGCLLVFADKCCYLHSFACSIPSRRNPRELDGLIFLLMVRKQITCLAPVGQVSLESFTDMVKSAGRPTQVNEEAAALT